MALNDVTVKNAKPRIKQYRITEQKGLCIIIKPTGQKYWRYRYRFAGKEKEISFGVYPEVPLKEAREKCDIARKLIRDNVDPSIAKKEEKLKLKLNTNNYFELIAREWHENQIKAGRKDMLLMF